MAEISKQAKPVVVLGAGPGGLAAAKALLDEGLTPLVLEASEDIGGQWNTTASHSGIWPGMATNTSKATTVFSDLAHTEETPMFPSALQIGAYLHRYADTFGLNECVRTGVHVELIERQHGNGFRVHYQDRNGQTNVEASAVVVASGRYNKPNTPQQIEGLDSFSGRGGVIHAFDYPGSAAFAGQRVLTLGNNISGLEIASDLAAEPSIEVFSGCRKPRYIIKKFHEGIPADWRFFNRAAMFIAHTLPPEAAAAGLREQILSLHGSPNDFGAPRPSDNLMEAGLSQCQDYLEWCSVGRIQTCGIPTKVSAGEVTFGDGRVESIDAIITGTGYDLNLPFLSEELRLTLNADNTDLDLYNYTFNPSVERLAFIGQFQLVGPYFPVLELQARWIALVFAGQRSLVEPSQMAEQVHQFREMRKLGAPLLYHEVAVEVAIAAGLEPDIEDFPELTAGLVFGPIIPAQFRLSGHGSHAKAREQLDAALAVVGQTATPKVDVEQLGLLQMLSQQPDCAPKVATALAVLSPEH